MAKKLYEENNIKDIANAIREKTGETRLEPVMTDYFVYKSPNIDGFDSELSGAAYGLPEKVFKVEGASKIVVKYIIKYSTNTIPSIFYINGTDCAYNDSQIHEEVIEGNQVTLRYSYETSSDLRGVYAEIYAYDASNNQIKVPTEETIEVPNTFKVSDMGAAVRNIGGLPEEAYIISGSCSWRWSTTGGNWYFDALGDKLTSSDIDNLSYAFNGNNKIVRIPCTFNIRYCYNFNSAFSGCSALEECPKIRGNISWSTSTGMSDMIKGCHKIVNFEDLFEPDMLDGFSTVKVTGAYSCAKPATFYECKSMRTVPTWWYKFKLNEESTAYPATSSGYSIYNSAFQYCYVIDEILNVPVWKCTVALTSNLFANMFSYCSRLKNFTFETQSDGTPYTTEWKSQVIDLSQSVGYTTSTSNITSSNAGITTDKQVKDAATYQALKDDPDWFTALNTFSRYNRDSAVNTINSLPDTSAYLATAGGTNTIKFLGLAGDYTDSGAINQLTEEEIAVATAKGWTVTLV